MNDSGAYAVTAAALALRSIAQQQVLHSSNEGLTADAPNTGQQQHAELEHLEKG
jgi:hypothetical protein